MGPGQPSRQAGRQQIAEGGEQLFRVHVLTQGKKGGPIGIPGKRQLKYTQEDLIVLS
jgi:hypothetical protein